VAAIPDACSFSLFPWSSFRSNLADAATFVYSKNIVEKSVPMLTNPFTDEVTVVGCKDLAMKYFNFW
jgi:hypothetical protein